MKPVIVDNKLIEICDNSFRYLPNSRKLDDCFYLVELNNKLAVYHRYLGLSDVSLFLEKI